LGSELRPSRTFHSPTAGGCGWLTVTGQFGIDFRISLTIALFERRACDAVHMGSTEWTVDEEHGSAGLFGAGH
jgi:hypothetical protein